MHAFIDIVTYIWFIVCSITLGKLVYVYIEDYHYFSWTERICFGILILIGGISIWFLFCYL